MMSKPLKVFVSSPYTLGETTVNVRKQHDAWRALEAMGHVVFAPIVFRTYHDIIYPASYDEIMDWCLAWVESCDVNLHLPGVSSGADKEVAHATNHQLIIVNTWEKAETILCKGYEETVHASLIRSLFEDV